MRRVALLCLAFALCASCRSDPSAISTTPSSASTPSTAQSTPPAASLASPLPLAPSAAAAPQGPDHPPSPVVELAVSEWANAVRLANGDLWYWGIENGSPGQAWPRPRKLASFGGVAIASLAGAVDDNVLCAVRADATPLFFESPLLGKTAWEVKPWGDPLAHVIDVAAGHLDKCAVVKGGSVWCWGYDSDGQLGTGRITEGRDETPVHVAGLDHAAHVAVGEMHVCALRTDGTVWCWGSDESGQLGDLAPGARPTGHLTVSDAKVPELDYVGGRVRPKAAPVPGLRGVKAIVAGVMHTCALRDDATVWCWGHGRDGVLGTPLEIIQSTPAPVPGVSDVTQLASGGAHVCAVTTSRRVTCWGRAFVHEPSNVPAVLPPFEVADLDDVVRVGVGTTHACALRADGTVRCWGLNQYGELGDGSGQPQRMTTVRW